MNQADSLMAIALMLRKLVLTSVPGGRRGGYRCPPAGTGQEQLNSTGQARRRGAGVCKQLCPNESTRRKTAGSGAVPRTTR